MISPEAIDNTVGSAYHKAAVIEGLLRSPKRGPRKAAILRGLVNALVDDMDELACVILEARSTE